MNIVELSALVATLILGLLVIFQVALICGAPIGRFAWGGAHKVLPKKLRVASASSLILYAVFAVTALSKAGVVSLIPDSMALDVITWIFAAYFVLGIIMNAMSRSIPERSLMTPVAALLAVCFIIIAIA